ncbi:MAG: ATP-binding cassette domain-containing protein [Alphaproteobacteria bacterium]
MRRGVAELVERLAVRRGLVVEILLASVIINVLGFTSTLYVMQVMNRYIGFGVDATLVTLTVIAVTAVLFEAAFREARTRLARLVVREPNRALASAAMTTLLDSRPAALERVPQSHRQEVIRGLDAVEQAYSAANLASLMDLPFAVLFIGALFVLHPALGTVALLVWGLQVGTTLLSQWRLRTPTRRVTDAQANVGAVVAAAVAATDTVRAFLGADGLKSRWERDRDALSRSRETVGGIQGAVTTLSGVIGGLQGIAIICFGSVLVVRGDLTAGAMIGANILAARALQPVSRFAAMLDTFARANQALKVVEDFTALPRESRGGTRPPTFSGRVALMDVAFTFPGAPMPLFESLDLQLAPGQVMLVTGPNGSGKTTLARLLVGLLEPGRGQVMADGIDLRQLDSRWWRRQVGYLPQEPTFLPGSIGDNLRALDPTLDTERLNAILASAGLKGFVDGQPQGLETPIVDGGRTLALGLRRRLALARALVNPIRLAVFDEPTEGMDGEGVAALHAVVNGLAARGTTLVVVSHDPSALKGADVVLDLGVKPIPRLTRSARSGRESADV